METFKNFSDFKKIKLKSSSLGRGSDPKFIVGHTVIRHRASGNQPLARVGE